jgi:hypothetical protein
MCIRQDNEIILLVLGTFSVTLKFYRHIISEIESFSVIGCKGMKGSYLTGPVIKKGLFELLGH